MNQVMIDNYTSIDQAELLKEVQESVKNIKKWIDGIKKVTREVTGRFLSTQQIGEKEQQSTIATQYLPAENTSEKLQEFYDVLAKGGTTKVYSQKVAKEVTLSITSDQIVSKQIQDLQELTEKLDRSSGNSSKVLAELDAAIKEYDDILQALRNIIKGLQATEKVLNHLDQEIAKQSEGKLSYGDGTTSIEFDVENPENSKLMVGTRLYENGQDQGMVLFGYNISSSGELFNGKIIYSLNNGKVFSHRVAGNKADQIADSLNLKLENLVEEIAKSKAQEKNNSFKRISISSTQDSDVEEIKIDPEEKSYFQAILQKHNIPTNVNSDQYFSHLEKALKSDKKLSEIMVATLFQETKLPDKVINLVMENFDKLNSSDQSNFIFSQKIPAGKNRVKYISQIATETRSLKKMYKLFYAQELNSDEFKKIQIRNPNLSREDNSILSYRARVAHANMDTFNKKNARIERANTQGNIGSLVIKEIKKLEESEKKDNLGNFFIRDNQYIRTFKIPAFDQIELFKRTEVKKNFVCYEYSSKYISNLGDVIIQLEIIDHKNLSIKSFMQKENEEKNKIYEKFMGNIYEIKYEHLLAEIKKIDDNLISEQIWIGEDEQKESVKVIEYTVSKVSFAEKIDFQNPQKKIVLKVNKGKINFNFFPSYSNKTSLYYKSETFDLPSGRKFCFDMEIEKNFAGKAFMKMESISYKEFAKKDKKKHKTIDEIAIGRETNFIYWTNIDMISLSSLEENLQEQKEIIEKIDFIDRAVTQIKTPHIQNIDKGYSFDLKEINSYDLSKKAWCRNIRFKDYPGLLIEVYFEYKDGKEKENEFRITLKGSGGGIYFQEKGNPAEFDNIVKKANQHLNKKINLEKEKTPEQIGEIIREIETFIKSNNFTILKKEDDDFYYSLDTERNDGLKIGIRIRRTGIDAGKIKVLRIDDRHNLYPYDQIKQFKKYILE